MSTYSIYALPVYPKMAGKLRQFMYKVECDYINILYFIFYILYFIFYILYFIFYIKGQRDFIPIFTLGEK